MTMTMTEDWHAEAACAGFAAQHTYDLFYEEHFEGEAKAICAQCNVRLECLNDAVASHEYYGVRGGLNPKERELLDRRWKYWSKRTDEPMPFIDWSGEKAG